MTEKIVFVAAHPDDAEIWSGGTLLNFRNQGSEIAICYMNFCDEIRKYESIEASKKLSAKAVFLNENNCIKRLRHFLI